MATLLIKPCFFLEESFLLRFSPLCNKTSELATTNPIAVAESGVRYSSVKPPRFEGNPMCVLEAQTLGLPVIAPQISELETTIKEKETARKTFIVTPYQRFAVKRSINGM